MKPLLRGYIHQIAFFIALVACAVLIYHSHGTRAVTANIIYSLSLSGLYCVSALYHCPMWSRRTYLLMRRLDHAAIFVLIAGSATPICMLGLKDKLGNQLLYTIWVIAIIGMIITIFWSHGPKWIRALLYVSAGWFAFPYLPQIKASLGTTDMWLLVGGGIVYTLGAMVYGLKRPNPFPRVFGYHEIFHIFVVIASAFHFSVIYRLTT